MSSKDFRLDALAYTDNFSLDFILYSIFSCIIIEAQDDKRRTCCYNY